MDEMKLVANKRIKIYNSIIINLTLFQYTVTLTTVVLVSLGLGYSCTTLKLVTAAGTINRHKINVQALLACIYTYH